MMRSQKKEGAAAVEAAIVLSLITVLALGVIEYGRALTVNQIITNAAREGARYAAKPNATTATFNNILDLYMSSNGFSSSEYTKQVTVRVNNNVVSGATVSTAPKNSEITVRVSVVNSDAGWISSLISSSRTFAAEVDIRRE